MNLAPCRSCRRHVEVSASACPFCAATLAPAPRPARSSAVAKLSRAAIFAGAAACSAPARDVKSPPPPDPDPAGDTFSFAQAPPPAPGKANIHGFVTRNGVPFPNVVVHASTDAGLGASATTGAHGEFTFDDLEPGTWSLELDESVSDPDKYTRRPQDPAPPPRPPIIVELRPGATEQRDFAVNSMRSAPVDEGPCCKPYGAPPARRRVV